MQRRKRDFDFFLGPLPETLFKKDAAFVDTVAITLETCAQPATQRESSNCCWSLWPSQASLVLRQVRHSRSSSCRVPASGLITTAAQFGLMLPSRLHLASCHVASFAAHATRP